MQNITVASDLSDRSDLAVRRGIELALKLGAKLTVHHVLDRKTPEASLDQVQAETKEAVQATIDAHLAGRDLATVVLVEAGDVVEKVSEAVDWARADLLVVGVHERRVFLDQYRETTMERLIRTVSVPVLMVQQPAGQDYAHVLAAVGLSRNCAAAIRIGHQIAPDAEFSIFHAHEASFEKESVLDYADWKTASTLPAGLPKPIYVEGLVADAVQDLMAEGDYDLLTVGAHTRPGVGKLFLGGLTASLIRNPPCDLLVAKLDS